MNQNIAKEYLKHLCTYFFIIFIPVIAVTVCCQRYFLNLYQTETIRQEGNSLSKSQIYFDGKIDLIHKIATNLTMNQYFSDGYISAHASSFYNIYSELNGARSLDSALLDIYYYNGKVTPDTLYSCKGTYNISGYAGINPIFSEGFSSFLDRMEAFYGPSFLPADQALLTSGQPAVEYVIPVKNQAAFFIFRIDRGFFDESLQDVSSGSYDAYTLIDWNHTRLYSNMPPELTVDTEAFSESESPRLETVHSGNLFISRLTSSDTDLTYMSVIDEKLLLQKANSLSGQFIVLDALILLLGFTVTFFLTHQYYKPIRRLLASLERFGLNTPGEMHSLDRVAMGMDILDTHNRQLDCEKCLLKLLSGSYKSIEDFNGISPYMVDTAHDRFLVIALRWRETEVSEEWDRRILEKYREIGGSDIELLALEQEWEDMYILIAFFSESAEDVLREKLTGFKDHLLAELSVPFKLCVSTRCDSLGDFPAALTECWELIRQDPDCEGECLSFFDCLLPMGTEEEWRYPEKELSGLYDALAAQDGERLQSCVQELMKYIDRLDDRHLLFPPLTYTISHAFQKAAGTYNIVSLKAPNSKAGLIEFMLTLTGEITGLIQLRELGDTSRSIQAVIEYIQQHYQEYDLTVSSVADRFHLSVSNLSHQFKTATGVKLSVYIDSLRIERAKHLLTTTTMTIGEISASIGYTSPSSFIRRFKQLTAVTPKEYRMR